MTPPASKGRHRYGWLFAGLWLFYLTENVTALIHDTPGWQRTVGLVAVAGFGAVYVLVLTSIRRDQVRFLWPAITVMLALAVLQMPGAGPHALTCLVYVAATAMMGLPRPQGITVAVALVITAEVLLRTQPGWASAGHGYSLAVVLGATATGGLRLAMDRQRRLVAAQHELAALAVADERARIAADLHDILGHSLTVVTVKAELAQRLLDVDLERARAELRDLESLARDALADVRATALGMRGISLPGEIAAAREALAAANVEADLPGAADDVPTRNRELFAWTIREAVTNIVRHSRAEHAAVLLSPHSVEIVDDGPVLPPLSSGGQGLAGLRRRAQEHGAQLTAGPRPGSAGFRVRVEVPT
ncbi:histidine kinase [Actinoplanes sp. NBRC 101535]|uniref:sensor histidine kinase n=1 Tax=Actinoplanes sp. NBRC 101535 TaxID=3032196 RepID=UPI0024A18819|nr:histidine kinase [Actinoplanes sp. NBRC 101535]GLY03020.1 histidine kinase [Actinoplanes sp. NBRC 101535]